MADEFEKSGANAIPPGALALGLAGVLPFIWGAISTQVPSLDAYISAWLGPRFAGTYVQLAYGTVILSFMSGVLWGFATRAGNRQTLCYALSVVPALWAFFLVGGGSERASYALIAGFTGLLCLDYLFFRWGLTPSWWMKLRIILTALVIGCLVIGLV